MGSVLNGLTDGASGSAANALTSPQFTAALQRFQNSIPQGFGETVPQGGILSSNQQRPAQNAQAPGASGSNSGILSSLLQGLGNATGNSTIYNLGSNPLGFGQAYLKDMTSPGVMSTGALIDRQVG